MVVTVTHVVFSTESKQALGEFPGALDSCCNRALADNRDIKQRAAECEKLAWGSFVRAAPEKKWFRFGGGEHLLSPSRWRSPGHTGSGHRFFCWASAVDSTKLGLLIGKDVTMSSTWRTTSSLAGGWTSRSRNSTSWRRALCCTLVTAGPR